jgi:hypothetical protein
MNEVIVGIQCTLVKNGEKNISLWVESLNPPHPSQCVVIKDEVRQRFNGGVERAFAEQVAEYPGYGVKNRQVAIAAVPPRARKRKGGD